jgi:hypothetical protein
MKSITCFGSVRIGGHFYWDNSDYVKVSKGNGVALATTESDTVSWTHFKDTERVTLESNDDIVYPKPLVPAFKPASFGNGFVVNGGNVEGANKYAYEDNVLYYNTGSWRRTHTAACRLVTYRQCVQKVREWIHNNQAGAVMDSLTFVLTYEFVLIYDKLKHQFRPRRLGNYVHESSIGYFSTQTHAMNCVRECRDELRVIFGVDR